MTSAKASGTGSGSFSFGFILRVLNLFFKTTKIPALFFFFDQLFLSLFYFEIDVRPCGRVSASSLRKTLEINGIWKQYSRRKNFALSSCEFRFSKTGTGRKSSENFSARILLPRSVDFRCLPVATGDFPHSFLQAAAVSGDRNDRSGSSSVDWLCVVEYVFLLYFVC